MNYSDNCAEATCFLFFLPLSLEYIWNGLIFAVELYYVYT